MSNVTGHQRCQAVLAGGVADRVPVVPQTFMFAAETAGMKVGEFARNAAKMVEAQVVSQEQYGYDAGPSLISPAMYREFALEPEIRLTGEVQAAGLPFSIHICGNTNGIIADMGRTRAKILEVDWKLDMAEARRAVPATTVLMGNVNPSDPLVLVTPADVEAAARKVIEATGGQGLFLSSGCAMGRNTPPENKKALVAAAAKYGTI
jgi:uroporphyrinogen-III decarboxylase